MNDDEIKQLLKEILKWQRIQGIKTLKEILYTLLDDKDNIKKIVYENTDGEKTVRDLQKISKTNISTISKWWNEWYSLGILEKKGQKYKKIISLKELSIPFEGNKDDKKD